MGLITVLFSLLKIIYLYLVINFVNSCFIEVVLKVNAIQYIHEYNIRAVFKYYLTNGDRISNQKAN